MALTFPVFVVDSDGWMLRVDSPAGLGYYEQIDIENHEYTCWDSNGFLCKMTWDNAAGAELRSLDRPAQPQELLAAARKSARLWKVELPGSVSDPSEIVDRVEREVASRSIWGRLSRFFARTSR